MNTKFQNKYRIPSNRLRGYDYGSHGLYLVTICTNNRQCFFGDVVVETDNCPSLQQQPNNCPSQQPNNCPSLQPTIIGQIAFKFWNDIPLHYPFVELDEFVVMPNHIHGILFFNRPDKTDWIPNQFGPQSKNLGAIIRAYKSSVKRFANQNNIEFEWQSRFHDRIIRDEYQLKRAREYIIRNPLKWHYDTLKQ